jgi:molybdenum cofactor cytidylyltransferase
VATKAEERLSAIVLAAGAGTRMGGPKALLVIDGEPLARLHARRLREAGCGAVVIVTRAEIAARGVLDCDASRVAVSGAPDPAGSLAIGLVALGPSPEDIVVVTPVDAWPARVETIARLVDAVRNRADAASPVYVGKGGHPVVVRARVLACDAPRPLRDVLAALGSRRVRIEVDDPSVAIDLDTPDAVLAKTGSPPRFA